MADSLAKLRLVLEIDGDKVVVNGLNGVDAAVERTSRSTATATGRMASEHERLITGYARVSVATDDNADRIEKSADRATTATGRMAGEHARHMTAMADNYHTVHGGMTEFEQKVQSVTMRVWNLTMAAGLIAAPFVAAGVAIKGAADTIDEFQMGAVKNAALITSFQGGTNVADNYEKAVVYATALQGKMEEIDADSFANARQLGMINEEFIKQGDLLDINNKKQTAGFTDIANAVAVISAGMDGEMQFHQEIRGLLTGEVNARNTLAGQVDAMIKREGVYRDGLKEALPIWQQEGTVIENIGRYLVGYAAANRDISSSWSAIKSSAATVKNILTREGFQDVFVSLRDNAKDLVDFLKAHKDGAGEAIRGLIDLLGHATIVLSAYLVIVKGIPAAVGAAPAAITMLTGVWAKLNAEVAFGTSAQTVTRIGMFGETINTSATTAAAGLSKLQVATSLLFAAITGYEIGKWLYDQFDIVKKFSIALVGGIMKLVNDVKYNFLELMEVGKGVWDWLKGKGYTGDVGVQRYLQEHARAVADIDAYMDEELAKLNKRAGGTVTTPKLTPVKAATDTDEMSPSDYTRLLSQAHEQYLAYSKAFDERVLASLRNATSLQLAALEDRHRQGLVSEQRYLDERFELEKAGLDKELSQLDDRFANIAAARTTAEKQMLASATRQGGETVYDANALTAWMKAEKDYQDILKEREGLETKIAMSEQTWHSDSATLRQKEIEDYQKLGEEVDAFYAERVKQENELLKLGAEAEAELMSPMERDLQALQDVFEERLALIEDALAKEVVTTEQAAKLKAAIEESHALKTVETQEQYWQRSISTFSGLMSDLSASMDKSSREQFEIAKALNIGVTIMNTASAVMRAYSDLGPIAGSVAAAIIIATGAMQLAAIQNSSFGSGGSIAGAGPGFSGSATSSGAAFTGSGVGAPTTSLHDDVSQAALQRLAASADNASLAIGRVADGLIEINAFFEEGLGAAVASALMLVTRGMIGHIGEGAMLQLGLSGGNFSGSYVSGSYYQGLPNSSSLDATTSAVLQNYVEQIKATLTRAAVVMGTTVNFDVASLPSTQINTSNMTEEEIQQALNEWAAQAANALGSTMEGLGEFTLAGENAFDAAVRLSTALQSTNAGLDLMGARLITASLAGANAAYQLQELFGGADEFNDAVGKYMQAMYSDAERQQAEAYAAQRQINVAFAEMGVAVPATREEFRALVNGLDLTTEEGQQMFQALMAIAPAFGLVQDQAERTATALRDASRELAQAQQNLRAAQIAAEQQQLDAATKAVNKLSQAVDELKSKVLGTINSQLTILATLQKLGTSNLSVLSPERQYQQLSKQFATQAARAKAGDATALAGISETAQNFLAASRQYNASGAAYQGDYASVTQTLAELAGLSEAPTMSEAQQQIEWLQKIRDELNSGKIVSALEALGGATGNLTIELKDGAVVQGIQALAAAMLSLQTAQNNATALQAKINYDSAEKNRQDAYIALQEAQAAYADTRTAYDKGAQALKDAQAIAAITDQQFSDAYINGGVAGIVKLAQYREGLKANFLSTYGYEADVETAQQNLDVLGQQLAAKQANIDAATLALATAAQSVASAFQAWQDALAGTTVTTIQAHAAGGWATPGLSLVGEYGPELVRFGSPGYVYTAEETAQIMSMATPVPVSFSGAADNYELVQELKALRAEVVQLRKESVGKLADIESPLRRAVAGR